MMRAVSCTLVISAAMSCNAFAEAQFNCPQIGAISPATTVIDRSHATDMNIVTVTEDFFVNYEMQRSGGKNSGVGGLPGSPPRAPVGVTQPGTVMVTNVPNQAPGIGICTIALPKDATFTGNGLQGQVTGDDPPGASHDFRMLVVLPGGTVWLGRDSMAPLAGRGMVVTAGAIESETVNFNITTGDAIVGYRFIVNFTRPPNAADPAAAAAPKPTP